MSVYAPFWGGIGTSSYSRSYTSDTIPSDGSITQVSSLTVTKAEVSEGVVVTTILSIVSGSGGLVRMKVNGTEINAEGSTGTVTSVMTIVPTSDTTANAREHLTATSGTDEVTSVDVPWSSTNTITCEALDLVSPSHTTLRSSRATGISGIAIYSPTWGDGA